jgi:hypothetical protein
MKFYLCVTSHSLNKPENKSRKILNNVFNITAANIKKLGGKSKALTYMKNQISQEKIISAFAKDNVLQETFVSGEVVTVTQGKWIEGIYNAHEFEDSACEGKGRKLTFSNGFKEAEIVCLDKDKSVGDGMWSYEDAGAGCIGNGCGDDFFPHAQGLL